jgi:hypothetical protein
MATEVSKIVPDPPPPPWPGRAAVRPKLSAKAKKKLIRRTDRDYSQITRRSFQAAFLLLNIWMGSLFYFWVRQFESGGASSSWPRRPESKAGCPSLH